MRWKVALCAVLVAMFSLARCDCGNETVPEGDGDGDGINVLGDGAVILADGAVVGVDGAMDLGDGAMALPDGNVVPIPDSGVPRSDAATTTGDGSTTTPDGWVAVDSGPSLATCDDTPEGVYGCQCSDGIDQPCGDPPTPNGYIDEYDIYCAGPYDNDECSWWTGIPGDNRSGAHGDTECFFDGDSGIGNDDDCYMLVPPGCDCYGCCEWDVNGDGVKEAVYMYGDCDRFTPPPNPQPGELGGACLANGDCNGDLNCITDNAGNSWCGPCEPCAEAFGGTECDEATGEGCCWNPCDPETGQICYGDEPPPPDVTQPDGGMSYPDGSVILGDGAVQLPDGGLIVNDGAVILGDGAVAYCSEEYPELCPDGGAYLPDGAIIYPDGAVVTIPDGSTDLGDGAVMLPDGAVVYPPPRDGGGLPHLDGSTTYDGSGPRPDAATGVDAWTPDERCNGYPYCGADGPCPEGMICYFACCMVLPG